MMGWWEGSDGLMVPEKAVKHYSVSSSFEKFAVLL